MRSQIFSAKLNTLPARLGLARFELGTVRFKIAIAKLQLETIRLQTRMEGYHLRDVVFILTCGFVVAMSFIFVFVYTLSNMP